MKDPYVSLKVAKLLKEKGFDWETDYYYRKHGSDVEQLTLYELNYEREKFIEAPTQQMACDWLEETHGLFIKIGRSMDINSNYYYSYNVLDKDNTSQIKSIRPSKKDAIESALEYALINLI